MKKIVALLLVLTMAVALVGCKKDDKEGALTKVVLNEVAHSYFYAPMYVAIELGYFEEEGIDLVLVNGSGADNTMTALVSGEADIGFMGSEQSIFVTNEGMSDQVVNFAQLTQRAGNFLVVREGVEYEMEEDGSFDWNSLKGKTVIGGRAGGMPEMVFEYILDQKGIDKADIDIIQNIDFGYTGQTFASGEGDYTIEFEPSASSLVTEGYGNIVASLGEESGYVPYTAFCAKQSYIDENKDVIQKFTNALQKGLDYVNTHTVEEVANVIAPQFEGFDAETIAIGLKNYADQDSWKEDLIFEESSYDLLLDILEYSKVIDERPDYNKLVTTEFAKAAAKK
ncbi:MAG: ABC transporter substrate-binding protein [Lachnospiraceae bacterium]|nr:ABC transporter substrate-binding protein [Lachnospiraceae bacterium]